MALARVDAMVNRGQMQRESRNSRRTGFTVNSLLFPWSHSFSPVSMRVCDSEKNSLFFSLLNSLFNSLFSTLRVKKQ